MKRLSKTLYCKTHNRIPKQQLCSYQYDFVTMKAFDIFVALSYCFCPFCILQQNYCNKKT